MTARVAAALRVLAGLDPFERVRIAELLVADDMDGDGLARIGVALVRRVEVLAKTDASAADTLAQAIQQTFKAWSSIMAGSLSDAIEGAPIERHEPSEGA